MTMGGREAANGALSGRAAVKRTGVVDWKRRFFGYGFWALKQAIARGWLQVAVCRSSPRRKGGYSSREFNEVRLL